MAHDLASLITVLDGILHPNDHRNPILKSLLEKATSLMNLLEKYAMQHHLRGNSRSIHNKYIMEALQNEIRDVAHEAEDIVERHEVDRMLSRPNASRFSSSLPGDAMTKVMEKFDAANNKLMKIIKDDQSHEEEAMDVIVNPSLSVEAAPTSSKPNTCMVGFDKDAYHLKGRLTSEKHVRTIIPIVGMGGIGKTALARNLYNDPLVVYHFDVRAWVTVSQDYNLRAILLGLLGSIFGTISKDMLQKNDSHLGLTLYQMLCGSRYLVVLDDIWSKQAWDEIKHYLPNENHSSRILITSRELDVAKYPDSASKEHRMHLLSSGQGWDLLCRKVFDVEKEESCPPSLEEIGQKIVRGCGGLPLAIMVIGGLLSTNKYSKDLWEQVAKDVSMVLSRRDEHFSKILSLSYDNVPLHLKPCFLYMAAFPEDYEVRGSRLRKLWVAEGFLMRSSSGNNKSLDDVAEDYLKALCDRNLLSVERTKSNGRPETYSMHDLLRDLCVRKADVEKFLHVFKDGKVPQLNKFRRVSVLSSPHIKHDDLAEQLSLSRSILRVSLRYIVLNIYPILSSLRLVRVLDVYDILFVKFPTEILQLVNLRFLAVTFQGSLPSGIWRLRNLQTLLVSGPDRVTLPFEAWKISGLRHIILKGTTIYINFIIPRVYENLQTIYVVRLHDLLVTNLINSMPKVRKLGIQGGGESDFEYSIINLSHLHKLENLQLYAFSIDALSRIKFPNCLKKVSLYSCKIAKRVMNNVVGALQYLELLRIENCEFRGGGGGGGGGEEEEEEEEVSEGVEFCSLQYLELSCLSRVVRWKADDSHFPRLRHLKFISCYYLKEIPRSIGEIETLGTIELVDVDPSLVASAKEIQDTQRREYGDETLQIRVH